ncbi:MAG TPA: DEAD/DEAH box helicase [Chloroflexota bacterium]|nr:DEAD/DEAH box helicase [Chloroflexota bacterium]
MLHGLWRPEPNGGSLFLWAERLDDDNERILNADELRERFPLLQGEAASVSLLMPAVDGRPLSSSDSSEDAILTPFEVSGLKLPAVDAMFHLLTLSPDENMGDDLRFWQITARFTLEMLARERYVPAINDHNVALWQPVLTGDDRQRFARLARAMPPVCRALMPHGSPPSGTTILDSFVRTTIDALCRQSLARWEPSVPPRISQGNRAQAYIWLLSLARPRDEETPTTIKIDQRLRGAVRKWLEPLQVVANEAFRTTFRLESPSNPRAPWILRFFLQSVEDPSLLVPVGQVWKQRGNGWNLVKAKQGRAQEKLLSDLGTAMRIFPPLEKSLKTAHPEIAHLSVHQAHTFLREAAPILEESGMGVIVPHWWLNRRRGLAARIRLAPGNANGNGSSVLGLDSLVHYDWQLSLGGKGVSPEEFAKLASLKAPLVRVRGEWVELNPEDVKKAQDFWEKNGGDTLPLAKALSLAAGTSELDSDLPVESVETEGWLNALFEKDGHIPDLEKPAGFVGELRPYQERGVSWMYFLLERGLNPCLADDMGLGKTVELISMLLSLKDQKGLSGPTLLICPMSVVGNWEHELRRFAPSLSVMTHHGPGRLTGEGFVTEAKKHDLVISTYALAARDRELLESMPWAGVVLDEAQNVKNASTKQAQAVRAFKADFRVALTGTPVENRLSELWSIMEFLNPGYLGSADRFRKNFALPIERGNDAGTKAQLRTLVQPFILRRVKSDPTIISDLPEKLEMKVYCSLTPEQASLYEAVVRDMMQQIESSEGMQRKGLVLASLTKLKQVCNHPAHFLSDHSPLSGRSGKLARLEEMLEEVIAADDRALIFTQYAEFGRELQSYLRERLGKDVLYLHGGTPRHIRDRLVSRFQNDRRGPPIFILSLKAGGTGLNLTRASHVFHFDRWWNPAVEDQATDRAFRIGQTRNVQVHKMLCSGTLEERIDEMIESKKALANQIVGSGESWLTELSADELKNLFELRREAVMLE